jgi:hypothetical protein
LSSSVASKNPTAKPHTSWLQGYYQTESFSGWQPTEESKHMQKHPNEVHDRQDACMPSVIHIKSSIVKSQGRPSLQRSVMSLLLLHTVHLLVSALFSFA